MVTRRALFHLEVAVRCSASKYFSSNSGESSTFGNHCLHCDLRMVLNHQSFGFDELNQLRSHVEHRLSAIRLATSCKDMLDISFPDCADLSMDDWRQRVAVNMADRNDEVKKVSGGAGRSLSWSMRLRSFRQPIRYEMQGWNYIKPIKYLSVAISESSTPVSFASQVFNLEQGKPLLITPSSGWVHLLSSISQKRTRCITCKTYGENLSCPTPQRPTLQPWSQARKLP